MKKRPLVAVLNTIEAAAAQLISGNGEWMIVKTSTAKELLLGPFRTGKLAGIISVDPLGEKRQLVLIDAVTSPETIVAATRYRVEISNPEDRYETDRKFSAVAAFTSSSVLSGTAATDRTNVYTALVNKINAYGGNNVTAYGLTVADYTGGTSAGDAATNFVVGETVTQETSGLTARVAKCTITSGTFAADSAAGKIWLFAHSSYTGWLTTAKTLTAAGTAAATITTPATTNCVVTVTNATTLHYQGLAILDDAGYFVSGMGRGGSNWVGVTQGFTTAVPEVAIAAVYSQGIGSVMAQLIPRYDASKQDALTGSLEYELQNGDAFDTTKVYRKYVFQIADGDQNAMSGDAEYSEREAILYVDYSDGDLGDLNTALLALT
jgi:hypothetical protein